MDASQVPHGRVVPGLHNPNTGNAIIVKTRVVTVTKDNMAEAHSWNKLVGEAAMGSHALDLKR